MSASSGVVLANLAYLMGAVVLAVVGGTVVWLRHRQPKSVDANVASFNRGLRALAPESLTLEQPSRAVGENPVRVQPRPGGLRVIRTVPDEAEGGETATGDIGSSDIGSVASGDTGPSGIGPSEIGPGEIGPGEIGPSEIGPSGIGPSGMGPDDIGPGATGSAHG